MWNRVGATLANSGHADEALQFYNQAIQLNPLYIRARYNIGISLINTKVNIPFHSQMCEVANRLFFFTATLGGSGTSP